MTLQRGQSMVEFAVGAAVLALMLLGTLALAGYHEVDRRGLLAARQVAYLGAWYAGRVPGSELASSLHDDLMTDSGALEPGGHELLVTADGVALDSSMQRPPGMADTATTALLRPLQVVGGFLGRGFDLTVAGLHRGAVRTHLDPLSRLPEPFRSLELDLTARFALLGDAWHAGGPSQVRDRAGGLVPGSRLADLQQVWQPLLAPATLLEPSLRQLCLGIMEPDRLPENRLSAGRTPLATRCP